MVIPSIDTSPHIRTKTVFRAEIPLVIPFVLAVHNSQSKAIRTLQGRCMLVFSFRYFYFVNNNLVNSLLASLNQID